TSDGGQTWTPQSAGTTVNFRDAIFLDEQHGWLVGLESTIASTSDGGVTWTLYDNPETGARNLFRGVDFIDASTGWVVGDNGTVLHTTDGGATWTRQESGSNL